MIIIIILMIIIINIYTGLLGRLKEAAINQRPV